MPPSLRRSPPYQQHPNLQGWTCPSASTPVWVDNLVEGCPLAAITPPLSTLPACPTPCLPHHCCLQLPNPFAGARATFPPCQRRGAWPLQGSCAKLCRSRRHRHQARSWQGPRQGQFAQPEAAWEGGGGGGRRGIPHCKVIWGRKTCENKMFRHCEKEKCVAGQECLFRV